VGATVAELLREGTEALPPRQGLPDPRREARWLLAHAWEVTESWLLGHSEETAPAEVEARYRGWLQRRAAGEPAHHLSGRCRFWGRDFEVGPGVLVPRPESELLVQVSLELPLAAAARVLDVGTGSGCLAVTLAAERPRWRVLAVDRSPAALAVASRNASRHGAEIGLVCGDLATALDGAFDLVVANLPYIPTPLLFELPEEVRWDPPDALDGGPDGLHLIRRLVADLERLLRPCGGALLELGEGQAGAVAVFAETHGLGVARRIRDLGGVERVLAVERRPPAISPSLPAGRRSGRR
jgi:release factor glutamine methyltransferase